MSHIGSGGSWCALRLGYAVGQDAEVVETGCLPSTLELYVASILLHPTGIAYQVEAEISACIVSSWVSRAGSGELWCVLILGYVGRIVGGVY